MIALLARMFRLLIAGCLVAISARDALGQGQIFETVGQPNSLLGMAVSSAGDMNGDGYADVVAGLIANGGIPGEVRLYSGKDSSVLLVVQGSASMGSFASRVCSGMDVDGDGFSDFAAVDQGQTVFVYRGTDGLLLGTLTAQSPMDSFAAALGPAGDFDQDGFDDLLVGEPGAGNNAGRCRVFSRATGQSLFIASGFAPGEQFGASVAGTASVDGDAVPDFFVGSAGLVLGSVRCLSGSTGGTLWTRFNGDIVGTLADLDGDGRSECLVGDSQFANGAGRVIAASGLNGSVISRIAGFPGDVLGYSVASLPDIDGDGRPDYAGGSPWSDINGVDSGIVRVASGIDGSELFHVMGEGLLAWSMSPTGSDLNGDGFADLAIGERGYIGGGPGSGRIRGVSGTCGTHVEFGSGCPGDGGLVPHLGITGCPSPNAQMALELTDSLGGTLTYVVLGLTTTSIPVGGGCLLLVNPAIVAAIGFTSGTGAGGGTISFGAVLPLGTVGVAASAQTFCIDPFTHAGFSASNAVSFVIT